MSWGTLSGSDGEELSGKKVRVSRLTPGACGTDWPAAALPPTQPSDTHGRWVIRSSGPMPPSHPSATSPVSVPKTSSFRPVSLGY